MRIAFQSYIAISLFLLAIHPNSFAQPEPCPGTPAMTSTCASACVICDIDGFTGINDLTVQGQNVPGFCTTFQHNMQFIAFIAGTEDLTIEVQVNNCFGGNNSLELGFFESLDCETFTPITMCDTDIEEFSTQTFTNDVPLVVGQHYYMIIDGSNSSNCEWTFSVTEGSTRVMPLSTSGVISHPPEICPGTPADFSTTGDVGAALFYWSVDGILQATTEQSTNFSFVSAGSYEVCVVAANVCDEAPESCSTIIVREIGSLQVDERICEGECVEYNNVLFCQAGEFEEIISFANGCDSLISISLEVIPENEVFLDVLICNTSSFEVGDQSYSMPGSYRDTILTDLLCDSVVNLTLNTIECEIIATTDHISVICNGTATGTLIFSIDQGEAPLSYTYTNIADASIFGSGTSNLLENNTIPNIPMGTYQIYISDNFGNDAVVLQEVTEPSPIMVDFIASDYAGFNISCNESNGMPGADGDLHVVASGGVTPYSYIWSTGSTSDQLFNLTSGIYTVTVMDASGCEQTFNFQMNEPERIEANVVFVDPSCDGFESGSIQVTSVEGGVGPYTYALRGQMFLPDSNFVDLSEGSYEVSIQDSNGCIISASGNLNAPDIPVISFDQNIVLPLGDSTIIHPILNETNLTSLSWTPPMDLSCTDCLEPWTSATNDMEYTLTVTSVDDCQDSESIRIIIDERRRVFAPNIFSPDGNAINESFFISGGNEIERINRLQVYDRWGGLIFEQVGIPPNDAGYGWDGRREGQELSTGVYTWIAEIEFIDGVQLFYSGSLTLIR